MAYVVARADEAAAAPRGGSGAGRAVAGPLRRDLTGGPSDDAVAADPSFDTQGWNSSYTGRPIPAVEMREWVERTVERILALRPRRVLEIGCGTGLLLFRVAPHCELYRATDFSRGVLEGVRRRMDVMALDLPQVELVAGRGGRLERRSGAGLRPGRSSTRWSSTSRTSTTCCACWKGPFARCGREVRVFVGDVRNLELLEELHTSIELFRAPASDRVPELRRRVRRRVAGEKELLLAPPFFPALARRLPAVRGAEILPKEGLYANELNRFRYDAILSSVDRAPPCRERRRRTARWTGAAAWSAYANNPMQGQDLRRPGADAAARPPGRAAGLHGAGLLRRSSTPCR